MECYGVGSGVQRAPGPLTSTVSPVLTRLISGGGRNDLPGSWGNLGAAWPLKRRDLAWLWMRCWASVGPGGLVIWVVLVLCLYYPLGPA